MPYFVGQIDLRGPVLRVVVGVSDQDRSILETLNFTVAQPVVVEGIIDTGAGFTAIDPAIVQQLSLPQRGTIPVVTPSTGRGNATLPQYAASVEIYGSSAQEPTYRIPNIAVGAAELFAQQGFSVLIGRDVLSRCLVVYDGKSQTYTLSF